MYHPHLISFTGILNTVESFLSIQTGPEVLKQ